jgi:hypothetical protein
MHKKKNVFDVQLGITEPNMLVSLECGEWKSVPKIKEMGKNVQQAFANYLRRKRRTR